MKRSAADNERLTELLRKLFGAWARTPDTEQLLGYATGLRDLSIDQIDAAVTKAIDEGVSRQFPHNAGELRALAPSVAALSAESQRTRDCRDCQGIGYRTTTVNGVRAATMCHCVSEEGQAKYREWLNKK